MRTTRVFPFAMASLVALAVTGCGGDSFKKDEPQTAARDFLSEALSQKNGQRACDYLTQEAQAKIAGKVIPGASCREVMEKSSLVSDKEEVEDVSDVKDLKFSTEKVDDKTAKVTVKTKGGIELVLDLQKNDGLGNLYEPKTPWRIVGGAEPLVTGPVA